MTNLNNKKKSALNQILAAVSKVSGKGVLYSSALLGTLALLPGVELPGILGAIAAGLGVEAMGSIIDRVASDDDISDEELVDLVSQAIELSKLDDLLTKDEFFNAFRLLRRGQRLASEQNQAIYTVVKRIEELVQETEDFGIGIPTSASHYIAHPFPFQQNFTGRVQEKRILTDWLTKNEKSLCAITGIGGMGKSSLAWNWIQENIFNASQHIPLLWWSFYREGETRFSRFVYDAIAYLTDHKTDPDSLGTEYDQTRTLINLIQSQNCLIIMDGFERELLAYSSYSVPYSSKSNPTNDKLIHPRACTNINASRFLRWAASSNGKGKIILTTRLLPKELEGDDLILLPDVVQINLTSLQLDQSVNFLRSQGLKGLDYELQEAARICHNQPLNLRTLSGFILNDPQKPGDVRVLQDFAWDPNLAQSERQKELLNISFVYLSRDAQLLAINLAFSRSVFSYTTILAISREIGLNQTQTRDAITQLVDRNLLLKEGSIDTYQFHPIVAKYFQAQRDNKTEGHRLWARIYAESLAHLFEKPKAIPTKVKLDDKTIKLRDGLLNNANKDENPAEYLELLKKLGDSLGPYVESLVIPDSEDTVIVMVEVKPKIETDSELQKAIEYVHHLAQSGEMKNATSFYLTFVENRLLDPYLRINALSELDKQEPIVSNLLGIAHADSGQLKESLEYQQHLLNTDLQLEINEGQKTYSLIGDPSSAAVMLGNIADVEFNLGRLEAAREHLDLQISLCHQHSFPDEQYREMYDRFKAAKRSGIAPLLEAPFLETFDFFENRLGTAYYQKSRLLLYTGEHEKAIVLANAAARIKDVRGQWSGCHIATMYLALGMAQKGDIKTAKEIIDFSLHCAEVSKSERNIARANIALGKILILLDEFALAQGSLIKALKLARGRYLDVECDALLGLGAVFEQQYVLSEAEETVNEALEIADRCSYRLKQADAHLLLANLAMIRNDTATQISHASIAIEQATCDGEPNSYKMVIENAKQLLNTTDA